MGSLERAHGFRDIVKELDEKIAAVRRTESVEVKRRYLTKLEEERALYRGMYQAEMDIYNGDEKRPPRKFILNEDGVTFRIDPKWKPEQDGTYDYRKGAM